MGEKRAKRDAREKRGISIFFNVKIRNVFHWNLMKITEIWDLKKQQFQFFGGMSRFALLPNLLASSLYRTQ